MALTQAATSLTVAHQSAQAILKARIVRNLLGVWRNFDVSQIDLSWTSIGPRILAMTERARDESIREAARYYSDFREAEGLGGASPIVTLNADWEVRARVAFRVTGPIRAKNLVRLHIPNVRDRTFVDLSGSVQRIVMNGGRDYILEALQEEEAVAEAERVVQNGRQKRQRVGWARVTGPKPCAFCAMLASRGPVYTKDSGSFAAHDHCVCTLEPVLRDEAEWPGRAREFQTLWADSTKGTANGAEARRAFRRAYDATLD